jgi:hypothetical protein
MEFVVNDALVLQQEVTQNYNLHDERWQFENTTREETWYRRRCVEKSANPCSRESAVMKVRGYGPGVP